jgi:RNA polymerase sigma-70 factor (ECF subfamily)
VRYASARDDGPLTLQEWGDFHEAVDRLPDAEREVALLIWYCGLTQEEGARLLVVDVRTIRRRWQSARRILSRELGALGPGGKPT